ncbi:unnamed protein product [Cyprideis torosa]|uniref:Nicotinate phosphoribosyltransferase n=1 Tax=Cyprideis torosa TaxID=163714 RepID=A0A7R8ZPW7_9CRUS|nr:unnamed protein product [Cyprideis torosa]CAG0894964.1 unnamed protein product [Cyprideis torosa]
MSEDEINSPEAAENPPTECNDPFGGSRPIESMAAPNELLKSTKYFTDIQRNECRFAIRENGIVQPLLTDLYQITMAYAYWKARKMDDTAVFDLFFRKNPFHGEFTIFAGLEECLRFLQGFHYSESDIEYLRDTLPKEVEEEFFKFLRNVNAKDIKLYAVPEGYVVFPRVPLIRVEGPLIVAQLLETTLLTLVNYASLVATNAARYRMAAGANIRLLEFGLRRAQGPDGGLSASKYTYIGGFDGTSNVLAGKLFNIPVAGTHAHAFVSSFSKLDELSVTVRPGKLDELSVTVRPGKLDELSVTDLLNQRTGERTNFVEECLKWKPRVAALLKILEDEANDGELAAFISYAVAFPTGFCALVDTYDTTSSNPAPYPFPIRILFIIPFPVLILIFILCLCRSGVLNFCIVGLALNEFGYRPVGIRIDSGDLAYLSNVAREMCGKCADQFDLPWFRHLTIVASNDINEETILSLNEQGHQINSFGIGTHLVTCQRQPALGCVYKLVEINGHPRIKLSQDVNKITMPGKKDVYRLFGSDGHALIDLMTRPDEQPPQPGGRVLSRHPFQESKRAYVSPATVLPLYKCYWSDGTLQNGPLPLLQEIRSTVQKSLQSLRQDHRRNLNPTPYKARHLNQSIST